MSCLFCTFINFFLACQKDFFCHAGKNFLNVFFCPARKKPVWANSSASSQAPNFRATAVIYKVNNIGVIYKVNSGEILHPIITSSLKTANLLLEKFCLKKGHFFSADSRISGRGSLPQSISPPEQLLMVFVDC